MDVGERIAQVVAKHRDELLAQPCLLAFAAQRRLARDQPLDGVEVKSDEIGEELEHAHGAGRVEEM